MAIIAEGEVVIPMEEFWAYVMDYMPNGIGEVAFGVPKPTKDGTELVISFASSSDSHPSDWMEKPDCLKEWDEYRNS